MLIVVSRRLILAVDCRGSRCQDEPWNTLLHLGTCFLQSCQQLGSSWSPVCRKPNDDLQKNIIFWLFLSYSIWSLLCNCWGNLFVSVYISQQNQQQLIEKLFCSDKIYIVELVNYSTMNSNFMRIGRAWTLPIFSEVRLSHMVSFI